MDWIKICTNYFNDGFYNTSSLKTFVIKGKITESDYQKITGTDYIV